MLYGCLKTRALVKPEIIRVLQMRNEEHLVQADQVAKMAEDWSCQQQHNSYQSCDPEQW
jgi:hypothetical protein